MDLRPVAQELQLIFQDPSAAAAGFSERFRGPVIDLVRRYHLPLLILLPVAALLSPAGWLIGPNLGIFLRAIAPVFAVLGILFVAIVFDRVLEYSRTPSIQPPAGPPDRHLALYLSLPVSALAPFFFLHPLLGYLMLALSAAFCLYQSLEYAAAHFERSRARILAQFVSAIIALMIPVAALLFLLNVARSIAILRDLS
ncbi:MAG: hypothetical protein H7A21_07235 [Spirochaetales bacterium]|nr:hypothetical protein [Leptospiraceae bacterium]MCP5481207.1 hypothetical protein [Spirochaetales bacterium]